MITFNSVTLRGRLTISTGLTSGSVPETGCVITTRSHNTGAVLATHQPTDAVFLNAGAKPGTSWSTQISRWTVPFNADINEYAVEPGPIEIYLGDSLVPFSGNSWEYQDLINELIPIIGNVPGWFARLDYAGNTASDPVLVVAYTGGVQKTGLRVAYPQDSSGDTTPHPAVEILFNGAWRNGSPVDGACKPLTTADYAPILRTFPGAFSLDESGGLGAFGEPTSTASTMGTPNTAGHSIPAIVSSRTVAATDPISALGLDSTDKNYFYIVLLDGQGNRVGDVSYNVYQDTDTVQDFIDGINGDNYRTGALAKLEDGHLTLLNTNPGAPAGTASFLLNSTDDENVDVVFGSYTPETANYRYWTFLSSASKYLLTTPMAQFSPKGAMEYGFDAGYPAEVVSLGTDETNLTTVGDLIGALNALDGGNTALAYLENGHLVVAAKDSTNQPDRVLAARYVGEDAWREPGELLYGASDYRVGQCFLYDDVEASASTERALSASLFKDTVPARSAYAAIVAAPAVTLGDRKISTSMPLSSLYPVGLLISVNHASFGPQWTSGIEVTATNTLADAFNYWGNQFSTFRLVGADGSHQSATGFLRSTAYGTDAVDLIWYDAASKTQGSATRFFHSAGDDGTMPQA